jgi:hypothetical protein
MGVCVSEAQAETMEETIPDLVRCDRYSGTDDATPATDDAVPSDDDQAPSDDTAPNTDDAAPPNTDDAAPPRSDDDHAVPDDYWKCLMLKDEHACEAKSCTWCDTPVGFGVCMTGPSAEAAETSKWFTCQHNGTLIKLTAYAMDDDHYDDDAATTTHLQDPMDPSCALVYLQDPSKEACEAAVDANGNPCEFCNLQGAFEVCLNVDQAAMGEQYGLACGDEIVSVVVADAKIQDPMDPSCALVYLQDPSQESCEAAVDADGNPCEFCNLQGAFEVCLNVDQATMGEQYGLECGDAIASVAKKIQDPMDPSCALVYLQDPSQEACVAAVDADGNPCEFCNLQGAFELCLNIDQATMGEQFGLECGDAIVSVVADAKIQDPVDPSCALVYLQDPSQEACEAAVDADGNPCEFCNLQGAFELCLNIDQATMGEQFGLECGDNNNILPIDSAAFAFQNTVDAQTERMK